jgi:predicted transposase/invertase (TIGR01784 family)
MKSFADVLMEKGERKGMRKGMREGEKQKALAIAKHLRAKGMGVDEVADATGLTVDDVLRL